MGGSIAVTIRDMDGREHRMCRWTNPLPHVINNVRLFEKDRAYLKTYLDTWYEMRKDYMDHRQDKKFDNPMTDVYAPYPYLAPEEYGLIVIDMVNNLILHAQDYTSIGRLMAVTLQNDVEDEIQLKELVDAERITHIGRCYLPKDKSEEISRVLTPAKGIPWKEAERLLNSRRFYMDEHGFFMLDTKPFEIIDYRRPGGITATPIQTQSKEIGLAFRAKLKELGFEFTGKEKRIWKSYYNE